MTPSGAPPIASPRSRPIQGLPGRSVAPLSQAPGVSLTARTSIRPMRPEPPTTAIPTPSAIASSPAALDFARTAIGSDRHGKDKTPLRRHARASASCASAR